MLKKLFLLTISMICSIIPLYCAQAVCTYTYKGGRTSSSDENGNWIKSDCLLGSQRIIKEAPEGYEASGWDTIKESYYICTGDTCNKTREVVNEEGWYNTYICSNGSCNFENGYYYDRPSETSFQRNKNGLIKGFDGHKWYYYDETGEIINIKDNNDQNDVALCIKGNCKRIGGTFHQNGVEYNVEQEKVIKGFDGVNWYHYDPKGVLTEIRDMKDINPILSCQNGVCTAKNLRGYKEKDYTCNGNVCVYDDKSGSFTFDYIYFLNKSPDSDMTKAPEIPDLALEIPHVDTIPKIDWCPEGCNSCTEERECIKCKKGFIQVQKLCNRIRYTTKEAKEATRDEDNAFLIRYK